jgi:hypothetical protein
MNWQDNLPDSIQWKPREDAKERLSSLFFKRCREIEERIVSQARVEREARIDNFDSGAGIEDIFRRELSNFLPKRYSVHAGVLDDRYGKTAGDCDVIIFNDFWFPSIHAGATEASRKVHFPIEGTYAVVEIKSSLDFKSLDDAMEKLVTCHRLHRPVTQSDRIVENRRVDGCPHDVLNPLYSAVLAIGLSPNVSFEDLINRFFAINKTLKRHEVVRALCVLGCGAVTWGVRNERTKQVDSAIFHSDYAEPLIPVFSRAEIVGSAFYVLAVDLLLQLYHSVLSPEDLAAKYGFTQYKISVPNDNAISLPPNKPPTTFDPEDPERRS